MLRSFVVAVVRFVGKLFISMGISILLFLVYQLFGTNLVTEKRQDRLQEAFAAQPSTPPSAGEPPRDLGTAVAHIEIEKIELDWLVVEGVTLDALKDGPGHYPGTAMPGQLGNVVISGHRTTFGAPFYRLDEVQVGDAITVTAPYGRFIYRVTETKIVAPTDLTVVVESDDARLTLTTCHPRFSARQRLIVVAALEGEPIQEAAAA